MDRVAGEGRQAFWDPKVEYWNVPLMRDEEVIERPADQNTLIKRYSQEAVRFIEQKKDEPFFLYLAHNLPHVPLFCSDEFRGTSLRGLYGDVVEEIDAGVGNILDTLKRHNLADNTFVVFTSDNGPWLPFNEHGGSAGLLREGKGCTYEGGMREPTICWWPGKIKPGVVRDMGATMDLYTTILKLAGAEVPSDRVVDGLDLRPAPLRYGPQPPARRCSITGGTELFAVRKGPYKAHFVTQSGYRGDKPVRHDPPVLYHLEHDPSEKYDVAKDHPRRHRRHHEGNRKAPRHSEARRGPARQTPQEGVNRCVLGITSGWCRWLNLSGAAGVRLSAAGSQAAVSQSQAFIPPIMS